MDDLTHWLRGSGIEIVLIVLSAVLLARFVRWTANILIMRAELRAIGENGLPLNVVEDSKHRRSLVQVIAWVSTAIIGFASVLLILQKLEVPLSSVVAPATVLGAALGFGSQRLVQDLLSGFFLFSERQYGVGDVVRISPPGTETGISGTVEEVTLRSTRLRTVNGEVVVLPNGEIRQVTNLSRNWAQIVLDIPFDIHVDIAAVSRLLNDLGREMMNDDAWKTLFAGEPEVLGVEQLGSDFVTLRFVTRTLPGAQWTVSRELRRRMLAAFRHAGISIQESFSKDPV